MDLQKLIPVFSFFVVGACSPAGNTLSQVEMGRGGGGAAGAVVSSAPGGGGQTSVGDGVGVGGMPPLFTEGGNKDPNAGGQGDQADAGKPGELSAIIRDFKFYDANDPTTDPDFENYPTTWADGGAFTRGAPTDYDDLDVVDATLDPDNTPKYKGGSWTTHGQDAFYAWFHDVADRNYRVEYPITLTGDGKGTWSYDSEKSGTPLGKVSGGLAFGGGANTNKKEFFPIDDGTAYQTPFGNQGKTHNYSFTVEIHTVFKYKGGEHFYFRGDDDVFVYIDGKLVINLGGIHNSRTADVKVDTLGLTVGEQYPLDFFYAERHTIDSNLLIQTTLELTIPPDVR